MESRGQTLKHLGLMALIVGTTLAFGAVAEARAPSTATRIILDHASQQTHDRRTCAGASESFRF